MEPARRQTDREQRLLLGLIEDVNAGVLPEDVLDRLYGSFRGVIPYHRIGLALLDDDRSRVTARWARSDAEEIRLSPGYSALLAGSSLERILETGQPRILNDLESYLREHPRSDSTRLVVAEGMRSSLTCPLLAQSQPLGFLFFSSTETDTYREVHVEIYRQIAGVLSTIIEKARLYQGMVLHNTEKSRLLGFAAHDLRTPLTTATTYAELLEEELAGGPNAEIGKWLGALRGSLLRAMTLVNNLLDLSKAERGRLPLTPQRTQFAPWLEGIVASLAPMAWMRQIQIRTDLSAEIPMLELDRDRIREVIENLLTNAIRFSPQGGKVRVEAAIQGDGVCVSVADEGPGIPKNEIAMVFEEFFRGAASQRTSPGGSGLGLAIVRRFVEAHGGEVSVTSKYGEGATFFFTLPIVNQDLD